MRMNNGPIIRARYVISLPRSARRKETVPELVSHGFIVKDAVRGSEIEIVDAEFDCRGFSGRYGRPARIGEIGCTLSHKRILDDVSQVLDDQEWAIIAEDDIVLSPNFEDIIGPVLQRSRHLDFVILATGAAPADVYCRDVITRNTQISPISLPIIRIQSHPHIRVVGYIKPEMDYGALLYAVRGRGSRRLFGQRSGRPYWVADDWELAASYGVRIGLVRPNLAGEAEGAVSDVSSTANSFEWSGGVPATFREAMAIRTRIRRIPDMIALIADDLIGRRNSRKR